MTTVTNTLTDVRGLYEAAADRASRAWVLIQNLHGMRICLQRDKTLGVLGSNIYHDSRYDASENYDTLDGFIADLSYHLDETWPERHTDAPVPTYVLRPFLREGLSHFSELKLGYLTVGAFAKFMGLAVERPNFDNVPMFPKGLTSEEMETLINSYEAKTLNLINLLRHLSTTLSYVELGVSRDLPKVLGDAFETPDGDPLPVIKKLQALCDLPFLPKPHSFFSSESDKINRLTALPGPARAVTVALKAY